MPARFLLLVFMVLLNRLDIKLHIANIENIRIYVRGHNLYDIFYGRFKANENDVLSRYIELAPRKIFADILDKLGDRIIAYLLIYFQVKFGIIIFGLYRLFWYN